MIGESEVNTSEAIAAPTTRDETAIRCMGIQEQPVRATALVQRERQRRLECSAGTRIQARGQDAGAASAGSPGKRCTIKWVKIATLAPNATNRSPRSRSTRIRTMPGATPMATAAQAVARPLARSKAYAGTPKSIVGSTPKKVAYIAMKRPSSNPDTKLPTVHSKDRFICSPRAKPTRIEPNGSPAKAARAVRVNSWGKRSTCLTPKCSGTAPRLLLERQIRSPPVQPRAHPASPRMMDRSPTLQSRNWHRCQGRTAQAVATRVG
mgnify:CR=1 FL=1